MYYKSCHFVQKWRQVWVGFCPLWVEYNTQRHEIWNRKSLLHRRGARIEIFRKCGPGLKMWALENRPHQKNTFFQINFLCDESWILNNLKWLIFSRFNAFSGYKNHFSKKWCLGGSRAQIKRSEIAFFQP